MKPVVITLFFFIYNCHAYSGGAPETVCDDMIPKHPAEPQSSALPYKVSLSKNEIKSGEKVEIQIVGDDYKGLLVEVRDGNKAVGEFIVPDNDRYYKAITCHGSKNSGITHKNSSGKKNNKLVWQAPNATGKLTVYVTIAKDGGTYWARKPTEIINVF